VVTTYSGPQAKALLCLCFYFNHVRGLQDQVEAGAGSRSEVVRGLEKQPDGGADRGPRISGPRKTTMTMAESTPYTVLDRATWGTLLEYSAMQIILPRTILWN
jgi:hypothetical protein